MSDNRSVSSCRASIIRGVSRFEENSMILNNPPIPVVVSGGSEVSTLLLLDDACSFPQFTR